MTRIDLPTLGGVMRRFNRLWPNELSDEMQRRIIWRTDKAFAAATGQKEPERYTNKTPLNTSLLVPKDCDDVYDYAMLREAAAMSEGAKAYYHDKYMTAKQGAVGIYKMMKEKGAEDNGQTDFFGNQGRF